MTLSPINRAVNWNTLESAPPKELVSGWVMGTRENFAMNLKRILREQGLSQLKFSRLVNVHQTSVSHWFSGKNFPTAEQLDIIADTLGVPATDLIADPYGWKLNETDRDEVLKDLREAMRLVGQIKHIAGQLKIHGVADKPTAPRRPLRTSRKKPSVE